MLNGKQQRGRPKGSGIDDTAILLEVARLIEADPRMKPTTAIKAAGISDPSAVRRLRDKYRQTEAQARAQRAASQCSVGVAIASTPASVATVEAVSSAACVQQPSADKLARDFARLPVTASGSGGPGLSSRIVHVPPSRAMGAEGLLIAWMSLGLGAFNAALQAQHIAAEQLTKLPPFSLLMRQHLMLNEMAMAFCVPKRAGRFALH